MSSGQQWWADEQDDYNRLLEKFDIWPGYREDLKRGTGEALHSHLRKLEEQERESWTNKTAGERKIFIVDELLKLLEKEKKFEQEAQTINNKICKLTKDFKFKQKQLMKIESRRQNLFKKLEEVDE